MVVPPQQVLSQLSARKARMTDNPKKPSVGMTKTEWRRRFWHSSPGVLPFVLWAVPHQDPVSPTLLGVMIFLVCVLAGQIFWRYQHIERSHDRERVSAVLGYAMSVMVTLLVFPQHAELGLTVLVVLAFGDGSATLGGLILGGPKLPWNPKKTWAGFVSFFAVGIPAATLIYWGETQFNPESLEYQSIPFSTALCCASVAVGLAAIAESLPLKINDNIRVGTAAALGVITMHSWLLGL